MGMPKTQGCPCHCNAPFQKKLSRERAQALGAVIMVRLSGQALVMIGRWYSKRYF